MMSSAKKERTPEIRVWMLQNEVNVLKQKIEKMERDSQQTAKNLHRSLEMAWMKDIAEAKAEIQEQKTETRSIAFSSSDSIPQPDGPSGCTDVVKSMEAWRTKKQFQTLVRQVQELENKLGVASKIEKPDKKRQIQPPQAEQIDEMVRNIVEKKVQEAVSKMKVEHQAAQALLDVPAIVTPDDEFSQRLGKVVSDMETQANELQAVKDDLCTAKQELRSRNNETGSGAQFVLLGSDSKKNMNAELQALGEEIRAIREEMQLAKEDGLRPPVGAAVQDLEKNVDDDVSRALSDVKEGVDGDGTPLAGSDLEGRMEMFWEGATKLEEHLAEQFQIHENQLQAAIDECGTVAQEITGKMVDTWDGQFAELLQFVDQHTQDQTSKSIEMLNAVQEVKDQHVALQFKLEAVTTTWEKKLKHFIERVKQPVNDEQRAHKELRIQMIDDFEQEKVSWKQAVDEVNSTVNKRIEALENATEAQAMTKISIEESSSRFRAEFDELIVLARLQVEHAASINETNVRERQERLREDEERHAKFDAWNSQFHDLSRKVKLHTRQLKDATDKSIRFSQHRDTVEDELEDTKGMYAAASSELAATTEKLDMYKSECERLREQRQRATQFRACLEKRKGQLHELLSGKVDDYTTLDARDADNETTQLR